MSQFIKYLYKTKYFYSVKYLSEEFFWTYTLPGAQDGEKMAGMTYFVDR